MDPKLDFDEDEDLDDGQLIKAFKVVDHNTVAVGLSVSWQCCLFASICSSAESHLCQFLSLPLSLPSSLPPSLPPSISSSSLSPSLPPSLPPSLHLFLLPSQSYSTRLKWRKCKVCIIILVSAARKWIILYAHKVCIS